MNLIDERNKRTVKRKIAKKEYDQIITLAVNEGNFVQTVRLLDEGAVVMADGQIDFYIAKGTLEKYLEALPDDYEGTINLGHNSFATFPFILGTWKKSDLHLVDIGEGRKGLDVDLKLDYENIFVKELQRAPYTLGVSAEFAYHIDEEASQEIGVEILDDIFITDFAIVGEAGNVGSSGINLNMKGGTKVTLKELNEKLGLSADEVTEEVAEEVTEEVAEEVAEEATEETEEVAEEVPEETEEASEEEEEEKIELQVEVTDVNETEEMLHVMSDVIEKMKAKIEVLSEQVVSLTAEKEASEAKLAAQLDKEKKYGEKFKELYASIADEKHVETKNSPAYTDGIGEW